MTESKIRMNGGAFLCGLTCLLEQGEGSAEQRATRIIPQHDARLLAFNLYVMFSFPVEVAVAIHDLAT